MIKLKPTTGLLVANSIIPLTQVFNTNRRFTLSNNTITVNSTGYVELDGYITLTATVAGTLTINVLVDGNVVATTSAVAESVGDIISIPVYDLFRVSPNLTNTYSNISLQLVTPANVSNGIISLKYIR